MNNTYSQYFYLCIYSSNVISSPSLDYKLQEDKDHIV